MEPQQLTDLTLRWIAGESLTDLEQQRLLDRLKDSPEARAELLDDEETDSLLRCLSCLESTADPFLQGCRQRLFAESASCGNVVEALAGTIAAPPVIVARTPHQKEQPRESRWQSNHVWGQWIAIATAMAAALLISIVGWQAFSYKSGAVAPDTAVAKHESPSSSKITKLVADQSSVDQSQKAQPEIPLAFATLKQSAQAVWSEPHAQGDRLAAGTLKLTSGTAELCFDRGTVARLTGPAVLELHRVDEVYLQQGHVSVLVPALAIGFAVVTPLSRIVDLGTEFDVTVEDAGLTQTLVRKGRVSLSPRNDPQTPGSPIELAAEGLDRATVSVDTAAAGAPLAMVAHGKQGRFFGSVSVHGKAVEFDTPEAFAEFQSQAIEQLQATPHQFKQQWSVMVNDSSQPPAEAEKIVAEPQPPASQQAAALLQKPVASAEAASPKPKHPRNSKNIVATELGKQRKEVAVSPKTEHRGNSKNVTAAEHEKPGKKVAANGHTVRIRENGRTISITEHKKKGITVTFTEMEGGKKKTTEVKAANAAELAQKNPAVYQLYQQLFHSHPHKKPAAHHRKGPSKGK